MIFPPSIKIEQTQELDRKIPFRRRRELANNRVKITTVEECNLPRLRIKIEHLRNKLNETNLKDRQKLLFLSRKLDSLILIYQRALIRISISNSFTHEAEL